MKRAVATLGLIVAALAIGCGGTAAPGALDGQYAGSGGGLGAALDFRAEDPVSTRLRELVKARGLRVVVAFVVNHSDRPQLTPKFTAERFDGRVVTLAPASSDETIARIGLPVTRVIGSDDAATLYLLTRERPEAVTTIVMHRADGKTINLDPQ